MRASHPNSDLTLNPQWIEAQTDRLLGFETLRNIVRANLVEELKPGVLADKIGRDKGYIHQVILGVKERH